MNAGSSSDDFLINIPAPPKVVIDDYFRLLIFKLDIKQNLRIFADSHAQKIRYQECIGSSIAAVLNCKNAHVAPAARCGRRTRHVDWEFGCRNELLESDKG